MQSILSMVLHPPPQIPIKLSLTAYREVSSGEWDIHMPPTFKLIECFVIEIVMGFGETLQMRRHLLELGNILDMVLRSLLRKVVIRGEIVKDTGDGEEMSLFNTETLIQMISSVTYVICK